MKISIVGIGKVGASLAYTLVMRNLGSELVLVSRSPEVALGHALDLTHASSFVEKPMMIRAGGVEASAGSDIVIVCASTPKQPHYTSRLDFADANAAMFRELIPELARHSPDAILIVITNPVDVMTWHALKLSGFDPSRVIGTGTLIDSARYRSLLSIELGIHPEDLRAYILGEHGDSQFAAMSLALTGGERIDRSDAAPRLFHQAVQLGHQIMRHKGYTDYAIAMGTALIVAAIVQDSRRTIPVSQLIDGYLDVRGVCLSLPAVIGRRGIERPLYPALNAEETAAFRRCADVVRAVIERTERASVAR